MELFADLSVIWVISFCVVTLFAFLVASTLGIGGPLVLMPVLMLKFSPAEAVVIIAPAMLVNNLIKLVVFRKHIQIKLALIMAATALPAAFCAAFFTGQVSPLVIKGIVVVIIAYALGVRYLFKVETRIGDLGLALWGLPTGAISGLSGTAGPTMAIAMKGRGLVLENFVATVALLQAGLQVVRLPAYVATGVLVEKLVPLTCLLAIASIPAVFLSRWILKKMDPKKFRIGLDLLLAVIGMVLLATIFIK